MRDRCHFPDRKTEVLPGEVTKISYIEKWQGWNFHSEFRNTLIGTTPFCLPLYASLLWGSLDCPLPPHQGWPETAGRRSWRVFIVCEVGLGWGSSNLPLGSIWSSSPHSFCNNHWQGQGFWGQKDPVQEGEREGQEGEPLVPLGSHPPIPQMRKSDHRSRWEFDNISCLCPKSFWWSSPCNVPGNLDVNNKNGSSQRSVQISHTQG